MRWDTGSHFSLRFTAAGGRMAAISEDFEGGHLLHGGGLGGM